MKRKLLLILIAGIMIIALAACAQADAPPAPTEQSQAAADQSADTTQEESADADTSSDADASQDQGSATEVPDEVETQIDAAAIFADRCARCHGTNREGRNGPALLPERLTQDPAVYTRTITDGSGPMPSFSGRLSAEEIDAMVQFILSEPE